MPGDAREKSAGESGYTGSHLLAIRDRIDAKRRESERKAAWVRDVVNRISDLAVRHGTARFAAMIRRWDEEQSRVPDKQYCLGRTGFLRGGESPPPADLPEAYASLAAFHDYLAPSGRISPVPFSYGIDEAEKAVKKGSLHLVVRMDGASYLSFPLFGEADIEHFYCMVKADLEAHALRAPNGEKAPPATQAGQEGQAARPPAEAVSRDAARSGTKEQPWADVAPEYLPLTEARKLIDGRLSVPTLSKLCKPDGEMRYMRKPGVGCKVHVADFRRYMQSRQSDATLATALAAYFSAAGKGNMRFFWHCPQCGADYPENANATNTCRKCTVECSLTHKPPPKPRG